MITICLLVFTVFAVAIVAAALRLSGRISERERNAR